MQVLFTGFGYEITFSEISKFLSETQGFCCVPKCSDRCRSSMFTERPVVNRYFTIFGHATGRLLLKRPGYEIDLPRLTHAKQDGCFFEVNRSPDRLDLSA
jgi:hypothetical protein